jgi:excisionase family DNA binding protein
MNELYSPESNIARQRKLDALFADQPYLSTTMRASRLHERLEQPAAACVLQPLPDEADEILRKMVEGRAGGAYESAEDEWWFAPRPAVTRESRPVEPPRPALRRSEVPIQDSSAPRLEDSCLTIDVLLDMTPDGHKVAKLRSADSAPDVMTAEEAAAYLRVSPATLRSWTKRMSVPHARFGRRLRYRRAALLSWLAQHEQTD